MKLILHLLKHDFILINRNKIIIVSIIVSALYMAVFKAISTWGDVDKLLILVIFNDPALLGFLFIGVMVLFEKNENTLQVIAVTPIKVRDYILSKSIVLTVVSLLCSIAMAIAAKGFSINYLHFSLAAVFTTFIFSFIGFLVVAGKPNFNAYIISALGIIILLTIPFLSLFDLVNKYWFILFPTMPLLDLFQISIKNSFELWEIFVAYLLTLFWCLILYFATIKLWTKNLSQQ